MQGTTPTTWTRAFIEAPPLEAKEFTLLHYGLPEFKKRKQPVLLAIVAIALGLGLITYSIYYWRSGREST